ncbi:FAD-dependent oxidoreductase [bacterium]|jgi:thioredoxin reductase (NADPH)|nr:FAD-dependent oxidoreductase [bacterium]
MIDNTQTETELERQAPKETERFDVAIIGAGPAGMSAALGAARANLNVLLIEKALPGGETSTACKISNYIGFPKGILGEDLGKRMEDQLNDYPTITHVCESVTDILNISDKEKIIKTSLDSEYKCQAIIFALGLEPKRLDTNFERQFLGRGVSYYARGDVEFHHEEDVMVIGGGNCACYAADYLSNFVNKVYMVHSKDHLRAVKSIKQSVETNPKIDIFWDSKVSEVFGIDRVEKAKVENTVNSQHTWLDVKGIFVYVGRIPPEDIISVEIDTDEDGFIITDEFMRTNIPGIYAAGDIRSKQVRQIATAVSDGMIASINVERDFFR